MNTNRLPRVTVLLGGGLILWLGVAGAQGQTTNRWISTSVVEYWETSSAWSLGAPSITNGACIITNAPSKQVLMWDPLPASTLAISNLVLSAPAGSVNNLVLTNFTANPFHVLKRLTVGAGGMLTITSGEVMADELRVVAGPTGVVLLNAGRLTTGSTAISNATDFVIGAGNGSATWTLAGGTHGLQTNLVVGGSVGSTGTVWASNCDLDVRGGLVSVGDAGMGQMIVSNSTVHVGILAIGWLPDAKGTLRLVGGNVTVDGWATLGDDLGSRGELWVESGEFVVTNDTLFVGGHFDSGYGQIVATGGSIRARDVEVGITNGASGWIQVNGAAVFAPGGMIIGHAACTATGQVDVVAGSLAVTNGTQTAVLDVRNGLVQQTGGVLDIDQLVVTNACGQFIHSAGDLQVTGLQLTAGLDADGDGLLNGWEQDHGLDPLSPVGDEGAAGDPDGDGQTNEQEQAAGTDPANSDSALRSTAVAIEGNDIRVTWTCIGNHSYQLQTNAAPAGAGFANLGPVVTVPDGFSGSTTNFLHSGGAVNPSVFYRVRLQ